MTLKSLYTLNVKGFLYNFRVVSCDVDFVFNILAHIIW